MQLLHEVFHCPEKANISTGISLEFHQHGNTLASEKILFIMGLWSTKESWLTLLETIRAKEPDRFHMVTYDNRGVGGSDSPPGRYTTQMMAQDALALMDYLNWNTAHVVGVSLGGMIATEVAATSPDRILSLSLLVTTPGITSMLQSTFLQLNGISTLLQSPMRKSKTEAIKGKMFLLFTPEYLDQPSTSDPSRLNRDVLFDRFYRLAQRIKPPSRQAALSQFAAALSHQVGPARLRCIREKGFSILVVSAEQDRLIHTSNSKRLYESLRGNNTRVVRYPNAGHGVMVQCADSLADELLSTFSIRSSKL